MQTILAYGGAFISMFWGIAHLVPTRNVVKGFGAISEDNRRIITMEWVAEGMALCFVGVLAFLVTALGPGGDVGIVVWRACAAMLIAMALLTAATGARTALPVFKVCPLVKTVAAVLLLAASWMG
jgi:hypothetical protein